MKNLPKTIYPKLANNELNLSHSSLKLFHSCERKLEFRKFFNSSIRDDSLAASVGKALHIGIQDFLTHGDFEKAVFAMMMAYPIQWQKSPMDKTSLAGAYGALYKACNFEKLHEYELAYFTLENGTVIPGVELGFNLQIKDYKWYDVLDNESAININYIGFIDLIMYNKMDDSYMVWDIKTTSKDIDQAIEFTFDEQCLPYGLVLDALLPNTDPNFEVAYWVVYLDHLEPANKFYTFMKSQADVQEWLYKYLQTLNTMKQYYNQGWFPRRSTACMSWNRPCSFFNFCSSRDTETLEQMVAAENANYEVYIPTPPQITIDLQYSYA